MPAPGGDRGCARRAPGCHPTEGSDALIFRSKLSNGIRAEYYCSSIFSRSALRAPMPEVKTHDLRHHYASLLPGAGVDVAEVAPAGDNVATVQTTYIRMIRNGGRRTRSPVDNARAEFRLDGQDRAAETC